MVWEMTLSLRSKAYWTYHNHVKVHLSSPFTLSDSWTGNITNFKSLQIIAQTLPPMSIFGAASSGTCSSIFALSPSGYDLLHSAPVFGDIRSMTFSPDGHHLDALD